MDCKDSFLSYQTRKLPPAWRFPIIPEGAFCFKFLHHWLQIHRIKQVSKVYSYQIYNTQSLFYMMFLHTLHNLYYLTYFTYQNKTKFKTRLYLKKKNKNNYGTDNIKCLKRDPESSHLFIYYFNISSLISSESSA